MADPVIKLADAVVTALNAGEFSQEFTAARVHLPLFDLKELKTLKVSVVAAGDEDELDGRSRASMQDLLIDVAVQQHLPNDLAAVDGLVALAGEIRDFIRQTMKVGSLTGGNAQLVRCERNPLYIQQHLLERRVFTGVVRATWRWVRS